MMRSTSLRKLRERGQTDDMIRSMGGTFDPNGRDVYFEAGESYDKVAEVLKLAPLPKRPRPKQFVDSLDADERAIYEQIDTKAEGLGDSVKSMLDKIGADKAAKLFEKMTGIKCGCDARRKFLNKWWPYKK